MESKKREKQTNQRISAKNKKGTSKKYSEEKKFPNKLFMYWYVCMHK